MNIKNKNIVFLLVTLLIVQNALIGSASSQSDTPKLTLENLQQLEASTAPSTSLEPIHQSFEALMLSMQKQGRPEYEPSIAETYVTNAGAVLSEMAEDLIHQLTVARTKLNNYHTIQDLTQQLAMATRSIKKGKGKKSGSQQVTKDMLLRAFKAEADYATDNIQALETLKSSHLISAKQSTHKKNTVDNLYKAALTTFIPKLTETIKTIQKVENDFEGKVKAQSRKDAFKAATQLEQEREVLLEKTKKEKSARRIAEKKQQEIDRIAAPINNILAYRTAIFSQQTEAISNNNKEEYKQDPFILPVIIKVPNSIKHADSQIMLNGFNSKKLKDLGRTKNHPLLNQFSEYFKPGCTLEDIYTIIAHHKTPENTNDDTTYNKTLNTIIKHMSSILKDSSTNIKTNPEMLIYIKKLIEAHISIIGDNCKTVTDQNEDSIVENMLEKINRGERPSMQDYEKLTTDQLKELRIMINQEGQQLQKSCDHMLNVLDQAQDQQYSAPQRIMHQKDLGFIEKLSNDKKGILEVHACPVCGEIKEDGNPCTIKLAQDQSFTPEEQLNITMLKKTVDYTQAGDAKNTIILFEEDNGDEKTALNVYNLYLSILKKLIQHSDDDLTYAQIRSVAHFLSDIASYKFEHADELDIIVNKIIKDKVLTNTELQTLKETPGITFQNKIIEHTKDLLEAGKIMGKSAKLASS
jgi:hypothetical protein